MMQDLVHDLTQLATMKSLWDVMGYPKLAGRHEAGAYYYCVHVVSGSGASSQLLKTYHRAQALAVLPTLPLGSYVQMFRRLTHELVGEQGRADARVVAVLCEILADLAECEAELLPLAAWRDEQMWKPERSIELIAINNRLYVELVAKRARFLAQARVLAASCVLPPELFTG